ncbi:hypothetical protein J6590_082725 [Homalodisca vitripennis]|nr:hypothetical protein J6590_082725 [Homalodisca vitripennis]
MPGTSAPVERVFSLMNNVWTDDRGLMKESTTPALLMGGPPSPPFFVPVEPSENLASLPKIKLISRYCRTFID